LIGWQHGFDLLQESFVLTGWQHGFDLLLNLARLAEAVV